MLQEEVGQLPNVEICYHRTVKEIQGSDMVEGLLLSDTRTGEESSLTVDGVFIAVGIRPDSALVCDMTAHDENGYILAGEDGITERKGIFVAGDVRKKPLRQIVTAVADGANAAMSAAEYCRL